MLHSNRTYYVINTLPDHRVVVGVAAVAKENIAVDKADVDASKAGAEGGKWAQNEKLAVIAHEFYEIHEKIEYFSIWSKK